MFENETKKRAEKTDLTSKRVEEVEKKTTSKKVEKKTTSKKIEKKTTSEKIEKKTTSDDSKIENFTKSKTEFRFLFLTEKRKNTNIETLKRLTIIVTVLTKSYLSTDDIAEIINESSKAKRRTLTQVSEIRTKLSKY